MIERVRTFLVVLEEGSVNRAALRLHITQPALSRQMQGLEQEAGGALLERGPAGVKPTELGHELARAMRPVVEAYDAALAEVRQLARGQRTELRIGYLGSAAPGYLTPALGELRRRLPEVRLKLLDLTPREQIAGLQEGRLDLALVGQEGVTQAGEFHTRRLAVLGVCVALPADHALAGAERVGLAELKGEVFIGAPEEEVPGRNEWTARMCRKAGFRPRFIAQGGSIGEVFALVAGEGAVALLPDYFSGAPPASVALVPVSDAWAKWEFLVMWQRGKASAATLAMVEALVANAGRNGG